MTRSTQPGAPAGVLSADPADVTAVDDGDESSAIRARRSTLAEPGALVADKYRLVAPLGEGGTGTVWLALHVLLGRRVALKILHRDRLGDAVGRARFRREALAVGALEHPGIVQPLDFGTLEDGREYLAMELVEGPTLEELLRERGRLSWREAARIGVDVAGALAHAHDSGIVHRDIKPGNLAVEGGNPGRGRARVLDLGIARVEPSLGGGTLTREGMVIGTPRFAAPEQLRADPAGPPADLYALGAVLYLAVAGRHAFDGESFAEVAEAQKHAAPPSLAAVAPDSSRPAAFDRLVHGLLAYEPADRPGDAASVERRLASLLEGGSARPGWRAALIGAGLAAAAAGLAAAAAGLAAGLW